MRPAPPVSAGDVLLVRGRGLFPWMIRAGANNLGQPSCWTHVIVASHVDPAGTFWGVEARPDGVGEINLARVLSDRWTITNADQPKSDMQRETIVDGVRSMLGRADYAWSQIIADGLRAIHAPRLWRMRSHGDVPGVPAQVVCSSLAAYWYRYVDLPIPIPDGEWEDVTPWDWARWVILRGWVE